MSSGPVEQLRPITSTSSAVERRQHRRDVGAEQHLAALRQQRDARSGSAASRPASLNASRAPKIAALTSRMSCAVSMMIRSAPPSTRPCACSVKTSTSFAEARCRRGSGRRTRAGSRSARSSRRRSGPRPTALRAISAALRLISSVCSPRPHSSSFRRERLEGVGLDDLGAGLDHRGVDALDHVGAVEDERLVALALRGRRSPRRSGRTAPASRPCRRRRRRRARATAPRKSRSAVCRHSGSPPSLPAVAPCLASGEARRLRRLRQDRVPRPLLMAPDQDTTRSLALEGSKLMRRFATTTREGPVKKDIRRDAERGAGGRTDRGRRSVGAADRARVATISSGGDELGVGRAAAAVGNLHGPVQGRPARTAEIVVKAKTAGRRGQARSSRMRYKRTAGQTARVRRPTQISGGWTFTGGVR